MAWVSPLVLPFLAICTIALVALSTFWIYRDDMREKREKRRIASVAKDRKMNAERHPNN